MEVVGSCSVCSKSFCSDPSCDLVRCAGAKMESAGKETVANPSISGSSTCLKREDRANGDGGREDSDLAVPSAKDPPATRAKSEYNGGAALSGGKNRAIALIKPEPVVIDLLEDDEEIKIEEDIDPSVFRKERRKCGSCKRNMSERHFSSSQWEKEVRICKHCVKVGSKRPPGEHGVDSHGISSTSSKRKVEEEKPSKPGELDGVTKKVKIAEDPIQSHDHKERRECRYCKQSMSQRHFSSSQWDKEKRTCRSCGKRREKEKSYRRDSKMPNDGSHEQQTMRIMLAKKPGAEAKFLCEVVPLSEFAKIDDLPCEVTLEGYTRQEWGTVSESDAREWTTVHLKCVDDKRYLQGFLDNLESRQKAAFGAFARPDGTCGVLVVPYVQPVPVGYEGKKGRVLFCKYALGLDPSGQEGERPPPSREEDAADRQVHSLPPEQKPPAVASLYPPVNAYEDPEQMPRCAGEATLGDAVGSSLSGMLRAQVATNKQAASAPKVQRTAMAKVGVPTRSYKGPTKQNWFGWRSLGDGNEGGNDT